MQLGRFGPCGLGHPGLAAHVRGGPGGCRGAALAAPTQGEVPTACTSGGRLRGPWRSPSPKRVGVLRPGCAAPPPLNNKEGQARLELEQRLWWPKLKSFLDIQGQCSPEGGSCVSGE